MDYAKVLNELRQKKTEKLAAAEALLKEGKVEDAAALDKELEALCAQIATTENLMRRSQENAQDIGGGSPQVERRSSPGRG